MTELEKRAKAFATKAHAGQQRKYTDEPYIIHPENVANIVREVPECTDEMIAAAWLHDTVEDTCATSEDILIHFGEDVCNLVCDLTDISTKKDGNRKARKSIDLAHTARASARAKTVKLADLIDNTRSIVKYDPEFAKVYLNEKLALLEVLKEGDLTLWGIAYKIASQEVKAP